jgi:hypothetical protein
MAGPFPSIPTSILRDLSSQVSRDTLSRASLQAAASKMNLGLKEFIHALKVASGEVGGSVAEGVGGLARQEAASLASQVCKGVRTLKAAGELTALEAAGGAASTAGSAAGSIGLGARVLGFFGRIGGAVGLTGTAATVAGAITVGALVVGATIGGARIAGELSADSPTAQYGDAANRPRGEPPAAPTASVVAQEPFAVWLVTNVANGSIFVGQESSIKGTITCQWGGGGLCADSGGADIPTEYRKLSQDYFTWEGAHTDYCAALTSEPRNYDLAFGTKATIYGGDYWIDFVLPCE